MKTGLLFLLLALQTVHAGDCRPDKNFYNSYGNGYLLFMEVEEVNMDPKTESLLIWWKDGGVPEGCYEESCAKKYAGFSTISKSKMFKKTKSIIRKKNADAYLLVWKDRIQPADDTQDTSVLKMSLAISDWTHANDIAAEYPLKNEDGQSILPKNIIELGCGINLLKQ